MTAYTRRGFRVRLILDNYDDHRKKCFFFVNVLREKYIRNVIQRIWHVFYKEHCSAPDNLFLEIDDFFIPPGESTLVLKENDVISVRVRPHSAGGAPSSAAGAVRSTVAPLTATPETLVESVALLLRRLQDGAGPDDSERLERERLTKVAEMMAAESGSTDVSTDEDGVRDLASQLTSRQEVVRLSQKMADQATPPPPCAAKKHNLDSEQLTLTEISRELRRRYEVTRQPQPTAATGTSAATSSAATAPFHAAPIAACTAAKSPAAATSATIAAVAAAASPVLSMSSLDSPTSLIEMAKMLELEASVQAPEILTETVGVSTEMPGTLGGVTSTPFTTPSVAARQGPAGVSAVKRPTHACGGGVEAMQDEESGLDGGAALRQVGGATLPGQIVAKVVKTMPRGARSDAMSGEAGRLQTVPRKPNIIVVYPGNVLYPGNVVYPGNAKKLIQSKAAEGGRPVRTISNTVALGASGGVVQRPAEPAEPIIVRRDAEEARQKTAPVPRKVVVLTKEDGKKWAQNKAAAEGKQPVKITPHTLALNASKKNLQGPAEERPSAIVKKTPIVVNTPIIAKEDVTPAKSAEEPNSSKQGHDMNEVKRRVVPVAGLKRARSPSSESSESSEEDSSVKSTPAKEPTATLTATAAASDGTSAEKKKKTRTRRRRGKKRRTPEAPLAPPPPPPPRAADYAQRHGLPRGEIDRYKRAASVGIGWQTRPKNRRVVFDDDGNTLPAGTEPLRSSGSGSRAGKGWRGATDEGGEQWAWSQGRSEKPGSDRGRGGWPRPNDSTQSASHQSGNSMAMTESPGSSLTIGHRSSNILATADDSRNQTSTEPCPETPSANDNRPAAQSTTTANTSASNLNTPSNYTPSSLPASGTAATLSRSSLSDSARGAFDSSRTTNSAGIGNAALGTDGRVSGSLGAGLLPRAFMRPRRCVDPPRRSEVLSKPSTEKATATVAASEPTRASTYRDVVPPRGSEKLLLPSYLLEGRAASTAASVAAGAAGAGREAKRTQADGEDASSIAETRHQGIRSGDYAVPVCVSRLSAPSVRVEESSGGPTPCRVPSSPSTATSNSTSANAAFSTPASAPVASSTSKSASVSTSTPVSASASAAYEANAGTPAPASHTTVVLDGSGRPAEARDLRHLAASAERRPLVVVRRDRPLPGRAPYRELTREEEPRTPRQDAGKRTSVSTGLGTATGTGAGPGAGNDNGTSKALRKGNSCANDGDGDEGRNDPDGLGGRDGRRGNFGTAAENAGDMEDDMEDDAASSPSADVYRNVSVILAGPPLEAPQLRVADSEEAEESSGSSQDYEDSEEESDGGQHYGDEVECLDEPRLASDTHPADASVDSITNCNVVNVVGQNRRLEKQRARGLPPGGDKENRAPTDAVKDDKFYSQFPLMKEVARKGDLIAFKCWDMAADYTPYVSEYREATVMDATDDKQAGGQRLTLQLLEYRPCGRRRGRFEITSPDDDEIVDLDEESGMEERSWSELIQPRLLHP